MATHEARRPVAAAGGSTGVAVEEPAASAPGPAAPVPLVGLAESSFVVGAADDAAERHADRRADVALARLRRSTPEDEVDGGGSPMPGAVVGAAGGRLGGPLAGRIAAARGTGALLSGGERTRMESAFGTSLGRVRVHRGGEAASLSNALSADAFTVGDDVFLGARAAAGGAGAERVLAHEIAHVLSEPGGASVRRNFVTKLFGKNKKTAKSTERSEKKALAVSRAEGEAGREGLTQALYKPGVGGEDESAERSAALTREFEKALAYETGLFKFLMLPGGRRSGGQQLSEEEAADRAYHQTWHVKFPMLEPVRPPRETAAERLVIQVRRIRTEGAVQEQHLEEETDADKAIVSLRMLGKNVELAYERMVALRDELMAKDPTVHPALAQDEAAETVRAGLDPKLAEQMPPKDGALDVAAWAQATERVAAKQRQAQRDRASVEESLALLPDDERAQAQQQLDSPPTKKDDPLAAGSAVVGDIQTYAGPALTAVNLLGGGIAGKIGAPQDKELRKEKGVEKTSYGTVLPAKLDQGISQLVHDSRQAQDWQAKGLRKGPPTLPTSTATDVKTGFGQVTGIFTSLIGAVQSAFTMATSIRSAWQTSDPYEGIKATKAGAAGLSGLTAAAKQTANLAKLIDSGVASGVGQVVPGLDIVAAVLSIVKSTMDVATTGMRQRETDLSMFAARARSTDKVDVTVYPLMQVSQVYTKQLENACWTLGSSIGDLVLSISQVASGGGFGIPLAVKAGKSVLDNLHTLGHFIADKVLATMAQRAQHESEVLHLEGAAEEELKKHPKMAVDGIVVRAAQGDPVALEFLSHYRIDGKPITAAYVQQISPSSVRPGRGDDGECEHSTLLAKIRSVVLGAMGTDADPKTAYDEIMSNLDKARGAVKGVGDAVTGARTTWQETGSLAKRRNDLAGSGQLGDNDKTDRGIAWRVRMFVSSAKRGKLTERTKAFEETEPLPPGVICVIGDQQLGRNSGDADIQSLVTNVTLADLEAELARRPRRNLPLGIEFIRDMIRLKAGGAGAGAA